jgi:membrane-bound lytic murein transglycosylase B
MSLVLDTARQGYQALSQDAMAFYKNNLLEKKDKSTQVEESSHEFEESSHEYFLEKKSKRGEVCISKVTVTFKRVFSKGQEKPKIFVAIVLTESDFNELNGAFENKIIETIFTVTPLSKPNWWVNKLTVNGWELLQFGKGLKIVYLGPEGHTLMSSK